MSEGAKVRISYRNAFRAPSKIRNKERINNKRGIGCADKYIINRARFLPKTDNADTVNFIYSVLFILYYCSGGAKLFESQDRLTAAALKRLPSLLSFLITCQQLHQYRGEPCPQGTQEMHRRLWRCGSSYPRNRAE